MKLTGILTCATFCSIVAAYPGRGVPKYSLVVHNASEPSIDGQILGEGDNGHIAIHGSAITVWLNGQYGVFEKDSGGDHDYIISASDDSVIVSTSDRERSILPALRGYQGHVFSVCVDNGWLYATPTPANCRDVVQVNVTVESFQGAVAFASGTVTGYGSGYGPYTVPAYTQTLFPDVSN